MNTALKTKELQRAAGTNARLSACILIVDDNPSNLKLASDALEPNGYVVERASDEQQARLILGRTIPNLILLDFALPGVDRLARNLRMDTRLKHVPIIALTAFETNGDGAKARAAGCDGHIARPVNTRIMPILVAAFLVRGPARGNVDPPRA